MTDRELLELAAKAIGIKLRYNSWGNRDARQPWDPLTDDGDALRLAVTLGLTVECDFHDSDTCTAYQSRGDIVAAEQAGMVGEVICEPEFAATRRAIVRAAAEIGKGDL